MPRTLSNEKREPSTVTNEERLAAMRQLTASRRAIDEANGEHRALLKRLKSEGIDVKAALAVNVASRQDPAIVQVHEAERVRMMALRSIISLDELINQTDHLQVTPHARLADNRADAEDAGYRAGKMGVPVADCPHPAGSEFAAAWIRWHQNGVQAAQKQGGATGRQMDASRERRPRAEDSRAKLTGGKKDTKAKGRKGYLSSAEVEEIADAASALN
jgi:hypothetical protein